MTFHSLHDEARKINTILATLIASLVERVRHAHDLLVRVPRSADDHKLRSESCAWVTSAETQFPYAKSREPLIAAAAQEEEARRLIELAEAEYSVAKQELRLQQLLDDGEAIEEARGELMQLRKIADTLSGRINGVATHHDLSGRNEIITQNQAGVFHIR